MYKPRILRPKLEFLPNSHRSEAMREMPSVFNDLPWGADRNCNTR